MRLDVTKSRELLAMLAAIRALDTTLAKLIRQQTKRIAEPEWRNAIHRRATTRYENRVMSQTATVAVSNQNVRAASAMKGRALSGGFQPKVNWPAVEFGMNPEPITYTARNRRGTTYKVTRKHGGQFKPRNRKGYVFWPAAEEMVPRLAALWVQTAVRTIATAFEGKQE